ncbi:MAG: hypothetical protein ACJAWQ_001920 [Paraglaciecola sp.]|jgi:hypothetical protein
MSSTFTSILGAAAQAKNYFEKGVPFTIAIQNDTDEHIIHPLRFIVEKEKDKKIPLSQATVIAMPDVSIKPEKTSYGSYDASKFSESDILLQYALRKKNTNEIKYIFVVNYKWAKDKEGEMVVQIRPFETKDIDEKQQEQIDLNYPPIPSAFYVLGEVHRSAVGDGEELPFVIRFMGAGNTAQLVVTDNPTFVP